MSPLNRSDARAASGCLARDRAPSPLETTAAKIAPQELRPEERATRPGAPTLPGRVFQRASFDEAIATLCPFIRGSDCGRFAAWIRTGRPCCRPRR